MRVTIAILLLFTAFSCKKKADPVTNGKVYGHILLEKNNEPIIGATVSVFGIEEYKRWDWLIFEEPFPYSYYEESTDLIASVTTDENGFYEINYSGKNYIRYILKMNKNTALPYSLEECTGIGTDDLGQFNQLIDENMEVNFYGRQQKKIYLDLKDTSCADSSVMKYLIIGHFEEDGSKNSDLRIIGDRSCDTILMTSGINIPGYVEWEYELDGQRYYYIDSIMEINTCEMDTIRSYY